MRPVPASDPLRPIPHVDLDALRAAWRRRAAKRPFTYEPVLDLLGGILRRHGA